MNVSQNSHLETDLEDDTKPVKLEVTQMSCARSPLRKTPTVPPGDESLVHKPVTFAIEGDIYFIRSEETVLCLCQGVFGTNFNPLIFLFGMVMYLFSISRGGSV